MALLECPCCDRSYSSAEDLNRHLDSAHQETLDRWSAEADAEAPDGG